MVKCDTSFGQFVLSAALFGMGGLNSRAQEADMNDFSLLLDTINDEGE